MERIENIETIQFDPDSDLTHTERDIQIVILRVHTDRDRVGLGETFPLGDVEVAVLHGPIARQVLGSDASDINAIRDDLRTYFNYYGHAGAEYRAMSALDIALWDLKGKRSSKPVYQLLGGAAREEIPVYNTSYDRTFDWKTEPGVFAKDLIDDGIRSMKVWPFDDYAPKTRGQRISNEDLQEGLSILRSIREAVGDEMEIALEGHGLWALPPARKIVRAAGEYDLLWAEDMIRKGDVEAYRRLGEGIDVPLCISERLIGTYEFHQALRTGAVDIVMPDMCWTGGISEIMQLVGMAEAQHLPVAPHNSGGPVLHAANIHVSTAIPNLYYQETIRDRYDGWFHNLVPETYSTSAGTIKRPDPDVPGLGVRLKPGLLDHPDTRVRSTDRSSLNG